MAIDKEWCGVLLALRKDGEEGKKRRQPGQGARHACRWWRWCSVRLRRDAADKQEALPPTKPEAKKAVSFLVKKDFVQQGAAPEN